MKKIISVLLAIIMIFGTIFCVDFSAFAREIIEQGEIKLDESVSVDLSDRETALYTFKAPETRYYEFNASSYFTVNTIVTDENGEETGKGSFGKYYAKLTAGKTYFAKVFFPFSDAYATIKLSVKNHEHSGSKNTVAPTCKADGSFSESCSYCGYYKREILPAGDEHHVFEYGKCRLCGAADTDFQNKIVPLSQDVTVNEEITYRAEIKYFSFTPSADGIYAIKTKGDYSGHVNIYDEEWKFIKSGTRNIFYTLESGKTYYISYFYQYYNIGTNTLKGEFSITASLHEHNYTTEVLKKATCISEGKQRIMCSECPESYDEVIPINSDEHIFTDGVCQRCGYTVPDYKAPSVTLEDKVESDLISENASTVYYYYTAEESGYYYLKFRHDIRVNYYYSLYDSDGNYIIEEAGPPTTSPTKLELEGGKTYTLELKGQNKDGNTKVWVTISKHEHTLSSYVKTAPTCVSDGERRTYCTSGCGYDITETIPATGVHTFANGKCKYCDAVDETYVKTVTTLVQDEEVPFEPSVSGEEGYYEFTPSASGNYCFTVVKSATGSGLNSPTVLLYNEFSETVKPFYSNTKSYYAYDTRYYYLEGGKKYSITVKTNNVLSFVLSMGAHEHNYRTNGYTPRCNEYVTVTYTCSCNDKYQIFYEPTGEHDFVETVYAPTCVDSGYSEMKCKTCGISYIYNYTPSDPEAHMFKNGICKECGAYEHEEDKPLLKTNSVNSFTMQSEDDEIEARFIPSETDYYYFRSVGSYDVYAEIYDMDYNLIAEGDDVGSSYNFHFAALLQENKEYIICMGNFEDFEEDITSGSFTFTVICGKHTHSYSSEVVAPTETTKGFTYYECVCGDNYVDNVKEPLGQSQETTCQHNYVKYRTYAPNCVDEGYTLYYCTKCYDTYESDITQATGVHQYIGNYCDYCGTRKPRNETGETYLLTLDTPTDVAITSIDEKIYLTFNPEESSTYLFNTKGIYNIYCVLYDENGKELCIDSENSGADKNAQIAYDMTAGCEYKFELQLNQGKNAEFEAVISKHTHDFADYIVPATCGEDGIGIHTCKTCFYSYQDVVQEATQDHDLDEKGVCKNCGYSDVIANAIKITDFNSVTVPEFEDYVIYSFNAPHNGTITIEGHSNGITMGVLLDNNLEEILMDIESSGEGMNFKISTEVKCGENYYLVVNGLTRKYEISFDFNANHSFELINKIMPTCTEQGLSIYKCSECGELKYDYTDTIDHEYSEQIVTPTCTKKGYTIHICDICGKQYKDSEVAALSHKSDKGTVTKKATYTATGIKTYKCTLCGKVLKTETIPKLEKKANTLKASGKTATVKYSAVKKKNQTVTQSKAFTISNAKGKVTYSKSSGNKKITVSSAGKITVKKGLKKGTYKVKVKVKAAGNDTYKAATKTVTVTIKVK